MCSNSLASSTYINQKKIKSGCQLGRKVAPHNFKSDLPLMLINSDGMPNAICKLDDKLMGIKHC